MDIEKLIEAVKLCGSTPNVYQCKQCAYWSGGDMSKCISHMTGDAATALSTLQAENERLRKELEYEREHANAYHKECGQWEAENTPLKEKLEDIKQNRDAIEQDFRAFAKQWWEEDNGFPCRWCKFERQGGCEWKVKHPGEICAGRAFEWRGPQKEG